MDRFDLIVVGCGPAGSTAARVVAELGLSVMIVDRRRSIGMPPRCAGYVPGWLRARTVFDDGTVLQAVEGIRLIGPGGQLREVRALGYILDRTRFDKTVAIRALEAGADLANALVLRREGMQVVGRRNSLEAYFGGEAILGLDVRTLVTAVVSGEIVEALSGGNPGQLYAYDPEIRQRIPTGDGAKAEDFGYLADWLERVAE